MRRQSLGELRQLFNALLAEMSLMGPHLLLRHELPEDGVAISLY